MRRSLVEFVEGMRDADTISDLELSLVDWIKDLGFQFVGFSTVFIDAGGDAAVFLGSFPPAWVSRYRERGYISVDPVARHGMRSVLPFRWGDLETLQTFDELQRTVIAEAAEYGISRGFSVPVHGPDGRFSLLTIAGNEWDRGFDKLIKLSEDIIQLGAIHVHHRVGEMLVGRVLSSPDGFPKLTPREMECLRWSSYGKTAQETARELGVAETTVVFHLENAKKKMGVRSKAHAVAKALALGLLASAD